MRYDTEMKMAQSTGYATDVEQPAPQPLTAEIMHQAGVLMEDASRIYGRLYDLRNRLFGEPNSVKPVAGAGKTSPPINSFSEAFQDRTGALRVCLNEIDYLSAEIANRL